MMLFLSYFVLRVYSKTINIHKSNKLNQYRDYCQPNYAIPTPKKGMVLEKVFIFHRHGDRSALEIDGTNWSAKTCKKCGLTGMTITDCKDAKCEAGLLTRKGYEQMKDLGKFIKVHYDAKILDKMYKRATSIPRTQASIHGVLKGIDPDTSTSQIDIKKIEDDRLMIPKGCSIIENKIRNKSMNTFAPFFEDDVTLKENKDDPKRRADAYLTAMCNNINLSCDSLSCDIDIIENYIKKMEEEWTEETKILATDDSMLELTFGVFVNELLDHMESEKYTSFLFSVHDKSISMLAVGFGLTEHNHPPYASALFFEIFKYQSEKFIRIIYNNKVSTTTIDDDIYIPYEKFIDYVNVLKKSEQEFKKVCEGGILINIEDSAAKSSISI